MDVNLVHSPYNNISSSFSKDVSGLYLSRAALTYRPSENMSLQILYRNVSAADLANPFGFDAWEGLH
jgi:hypothetical protein